MKIEKVKVLDYLKPKVKALGFKKDDIESIAADIADNLDEVDDEASDEDINAVIKPAVDAVIPSLKIAQKMANRAIEDYRKKQEKANEPTEEPKKEPAKEPTKEPEKKPSSEESKTDNETTLLLKSLTESNKQMLETIKGLQTEISGIKAKTTSEKRRALLDELLKDTGTFGKRTIKSFEKMKFETDDEFDEFVNDVKEDLEQLNQERANEGLRKFGAPKVDPKPADDKKNIPQPLTEAEQEELAASM